MGMRGRLEASLLRARVQGKAREPRRRIRPVEAVHARARGPAPAGRPGHALVPDPDEPDQIPSARCTSLEGRSMETAHRLFAPCGWRIVLLAVALPSCGSERGRPSPDTVGSAPPGPDRLAPPRGDGDPGRTRRGKSLGRGGMDSGTGPYRRGRTPLGRRRGEPGARLGHGRRSRPGLPRGLALRLLSSADSQRAPHSRGVRDGLGSIAAVREGRCTILDGTSYLNRPGPRLAASDELLAAALRPSTHADLAAAYAPAMVTGWRPSCFPPGAGRPCTDGAR